MQSQNKMKHIRVVKDAMTGETEYRTNLEEWELVWTLNGPVFDWFCT